jgi:HEAT repeat protein
MDEANDWLNRPVRRRQRQHQPQASVAEDADLEAGCLASALEALSANAQQAGDGHAADRASETLLSALAKPDATSRILAMDVVCRFSGERAAHVLRTMLVDPDPAVRGAAACAAERIRSHRIVSCLIVALEDPDTNVRRAAERALETATQKRIGIVGLADPTLKRQKIAELKAWWKRERLAELASATRQP